MIHNNTRENKTRRILQNSISDIEELIDLKLSSGNEWQKMASKLNERITRINSRHRILYDSDKKNIELSDSEKLIILNYSLGTLFCQTQMKEYDSSMTIYDHGESYIRYIEDFENEMRNYRLDKWEHMWNQSQFVYDRICEQRRLKGRQNEAEIFRYYMLRSRYFLFSYRYKNRRRFGSMVSNSKKADFFQFFNATTEYYLFKIGRSINLSLIVYAFIPILIFSFLHWTFSGLNLIEGNRPIIANWQGFLYSLYFSSATFTGIDTHLVQPTQLGMFISAIEGIVAFINTILGIGGILYTRIFSR